MRNFIDANDILINIRQYLLVSDFDKIFDDFKVEKEKHEFIAHCKTLIESGWHAGLDQYEPLSLLKPLLVNPLQTVFINKPNLNEASSSFIAYFTRLFLLKTLYQAFLKDPSLLKENPENMEWIRNTNRSISAEFQHLAAQENVLKIYGRQVNTLQDLHAVNRAIHQRVEAHRHARPLFLLLLVFSLAKKIFRKNLSDNAQIVLSAAITLLALYYVTQRSFPSIYALWNRPTRAQETLIQEREGLNNILSHEQIKKLFLISDEELSTLEESLLEASAPTPR